MKPPPMKSSSSPMRSPPINPSGSPMRSPPINQSGSPMKSSPINQLSSLMKPPPMKSSGSPMRSPPINQSGPSMRSPPMKSSGPSMGSCDLQMKTKPSEFKSGSVRHGLQTTPNSLHDPHPPSNQQDFKDNIKCVPIKTDGACKTKKRLRKKVRFDYPPEDNHKQSDSTEVPHNFDELYGREKSLMMVTFPRHVKY